MAEVVIKISGDIKNYQDALSKVQAQSANLEQSLANVAKISAVAFAALSAEIFLSVKAFREAELASNKLTQSMKNQGIFSKQLKDDYKKQAQALQELTGIDDDSITSGQAVLQGYLGQIRVSKELTRAVLDLSVAKGIDLNSAFDLVGKTIGTNTNALARNGIEIDANLSRQEKMAKVIEEVNKKFGGQAETASKGLGVFQALDSAFGDLQEEIGQRFAPAIEAGARALLRLVQAISNNKPLVDFVAQGIIAGTVFAALSGTLAVAGLAFLKIRAAMLAAQVSTSILSLSIKGLVGATGIGLLAILISDLALNWTTRWAQMQAVFAVFTNNIGTLGQGLAEILKGVFTFDIDAIKEGIETAKNAFVEGYEQFAEANEEIKQENHEIEMEADQVRYDEKLFQKMAVDQAIADQNKKMDDEQAKKDAETRKKFLEDEKKFGTTYAQINKLMHSEIYQGSKQAFGDLAALQQSSNATLKSIGKVAAIANIIIATQEAAMRIYSGFATIPIIGPALGIAGAAAAIAFGGERVAQVTSAAQGGLLTGGVPGVDSIPVLAQQGELISPSANFEEVIGSVRAKREAEDLGGGFGGGSSQVTIGFEREASQYITVKQIEDRALGIARA